MQFRTLMANEIECRVGTCNGAGCSLLLYQDSRCGMTLLDEVVGCMNWTRDHTFKDGKLYCKVGIWDEKKSIFIYKEDVGTESNTEQEKGQASDSFKRACVNWGIGRELYTAPFIWVKLNADEVDDRKKIKSTIKFEVVEIGYDDKRNINKLVIKDNKGSVRYSFGSNVKAEQPKTAPQPQQASKPQQPTPAQDDRFLNIDEFNFIKSNPQLMEYMKQLCGVHKYQDFGENDRIQITQMMRDRMKEMRN